MTAEPSPIEVSVVIPAYNAEATLGEQLAALGRQRVPFAWEILVCDNASTDATAQVTRDWQARLPQLQLLDASARRGPGAARNVGAAAARGVFLLFCDADDVVADDWVAELHSALQSHGFVTGKSRRPELNSDPEAPVYFDFATYRMPFLSRIPVAGGGNLGVRKSVFERVSGFDEFQHRGEDVDLCWRIQLAGEALATAPTAVVTVRNRPNLRATFSQAYANGIGDRRLRRKYARLIEAAGRIDDPTAGPSPEVDAYRRVFNATVATPADGFGALEPGVQPTASGIGRRAISKLTRIRRPSDLTNVTSHIGARLGSRFGRVEGPVAPLDLGALLRGSGP
ncbi:MAG TPA: glycosyltransferase [Galbitalea sp.]|jgi:glycosyltransferase involved in cell wall biosynthesis